MDIHCPRCGEPVDNDELHSIAQSDGRSYQDVAAQFRTHGCAALGYKHNADTMDSNRALLASAAYDLLGEDMDGAAAMLEDWGA